MGYAPSRTIRAFWLAVVVGTFVGMVLQTALSLWSAPLTLSEWWVIPAIVLGYAIPTVPFVAIGLALFGLPVAMLLRGQAHRPWIGLVAVVWGAIAGKLFFHAVDHLLFFGHDQLDRIGRKDMGLIYGIPTGIAWWLCHRRALVGGQADGAG